VASRHVEESVSSSLRFRSVLVAPGTVASRHVEESVSSSLRFRSVLVAPGTVASRHVVVRAAVGVAEPGQTLHRAPWRRGTWLNWVTLVVSQHVEVRFFRRIIRTLRATQHDERRRNPRRLRHVMR
jgi:hypothetical protein